MQTRMRKDNEKYATHCLLNPQQDLESLHTSHNNDICMHSATVYGLTSAGIKVLVNFYKDKLNDWKGIFLAVIRIHSKAFRAASALASNTECP